MKVHKKTSKRTVVEEEEDEFESMGGVDISYLSDSHVVSAESPLGMVIVNFLVHKRRSVTTNVVYNDMGEFHSLYNFDLHRSLAELGLTTRLILAVSAFETEAQMELSVAKLVEYLTTYHGSDMPYEDQELLREARGLVPARRVVPSISVRERGVMRESVPVVREVVRSRRPASPVRHKRTTRVIEEESSSTSTEEEVIETRRRAIRR